MERIRDLVTRLYRSVLLLIALWVLLFAGLRAYLDPLIHWGANLLMDVPGLEVTAVHGSRLTLEQLTIGQLQLAYRHSRIEMKQLTVTRSATLTGSPVAIDLGAALVEVELADLTRVARAQAPSHSTADAGSVVSELLALVPAANLRAIWIVVGDKNRRLPPLLLPRLTLTPSADPLLHLALQTDARPLLAIDVWQRDQAALAGRYQVSLGALNQWLKPLLETPIAVAASHQGQFVLDLSRGINGWRLDADLKWQQGVIRDGTLPLSVDFGGQARLSVGPQRADIELLPGFFVQGRLHQRHKAMLATALPPSISKTAAFDQVLAQAARVDIKIGVDDVLQGQLLPTPALEGGALTVAADSDGLALAARLSALTASPRQWGFDWLLEADIDGRVVTGLPVTIGRTRVRLNGQLLGHEWIAPEVSLTLNPGSHLWVDDIAGPLSTEQARIALQHPIEVGWQPGSAMAPLSASLASELLQLQHPSVSVARISGQHQIAFAGGRFDSHSRWWLDSLALSSEHSFDGTGDGRLRGQWQLAHQDLKVPLKWWRQRPQWLTLDGQFALEGEYQLTPVDGQWSATVTGELTRGRGSYGELLFEGLDISGRCQLTTDRIECARLAMGLGRINTGVEIRNTSAEGRFDGHWREGQFTLSWARSELLDGSVITRDVLVDPHKGASGTLNVEHLSLAAIVALEQQQGITITGFVDGQLPFTLDHRGFWITGGQLTTQAPGGTIRITDNPAIDQLRLSQPELAYALNALEFLNYETLTTDIDYSPDGNADLKVAIRGRNPGIERPIHFNYRHQENLLQLLRSLRIGDEVSDKIGQRLNEKE